MAEVKTADVKVGQTYRVRLGRGAYGTARIVGVNTALGHPNLVAGFRVEWLDGDRARKVVMPGTIETVE